MNEILLYSTFAGLATGLGGLVVVSFKTTSRQALSLILGIAAGINIIIAIGELIPAAVEHGSVLLMILGFMMGIGLLAFINRRLSLPTAKTAVKYSNGNGKLLRLGYMVALGIGIHNLPEGLAIGAGFEAAPALGWLLVIAVGLHNIPEGMGAAAPLRAAGLSKFKIVAITTVAGLATPLGTLLGGVAAAFFPLAIPLGLAFGAGAIMYIVAKEMIPESYGRSPSYATTGLTFGLLVTIILIQSGLIA